MAETTTTTAAAFLGEEWTQYTFDAVEFKRVLMATVRQVPSREVQGNRTIHVPHYSNLTANTKAQGTPVTYEAITQTNQDITISVWRYAAIKVNSMVDVQSRYDLMSGYSNKMGYAIARGFETDLAALAQNISTTLGNYGVEFTEDDFNSAIVSLDNAGAEDNDRFWWASPAFAANIRKIDKFVNRDYVSGSNASAVETANLGSLFNAMVVQSPLLRAPAGGQHDNLLFQRNQLVMVLQMPTRTEHMRWIDDLSDCVVSHAIHVTAEAEIPAEAAGSESLGDSLGVLLKSV